MRSSIKLVSSLALGAGLVLATAACGDSGSSDTPPETVTVTATVEAAPAETSTEDSTADSAEETSTDAATSDAEAPTHADPAAQAALAVLATVPGDVISIDRERLDSWEVLVRTPEGEGVEYYVNSAGEVTRDRSEPLPRAARDAAPKVTAVEAIDIALGALPGATVREVDLGTERGTVVWEIEVREGVRTTEFYIDATTGAIIKQEQD